MKQMNVNDFALDLCDIKIGTWMKFDRKLISTNIREALEHSRTECVKKAIPYGHTDVINKLAELLGMGELAGTPTTETASIIYDLINGNHETPLLITLKHEVLNLCNEHGVKSKLTDAFQGHLDKSDNFLILYHHITDYLEVHTGKVKIELSTIDKFIFINFLKTFLGTE